MDRQPIRILVVGATGALGRPVVKLLLERGAQVRALNRHPEQAADLAGMGAETVAGDLTDAASLQRACAGMQRVLTAAHSILGRGRWHSEAVDVQGHRDLIGAARVAGVQRLVHTSAYGVSATHPIDFFRHKHAAEQAVKASGLDCVILKPTAFMEHHVHLFNGKAVLDKGKAQLIGPGTKPRNFVAAGDVAKFAVRALMDEVPPFRELNIGGHDHASNSEVAQLYARMAGIQPKAGHLPVVAAKAIAVLAKPFHPGMARIMTIFSSSNDAFDERFDGAAALEREYGIPLTRLADFVRTQVAAAGFAPKA